MLQQSFLVLLSLEVYRRLLVLYPVNFREEYGPEMLLVFRDSCYAAGQQRGTLGFLNLWILTIADLFTTALVERLEEGWRMSKAMFVRLSGVVAIVGGMLGIYLVAQGPNSYGNYGWNGKLALVAALLLAFGFTGWYVAQQERFNAQILSGTMITIAGLLLMGVGYAIELLWPLIFIGPMIVVPIGTIILGVRIYRDESLPVWWKYFPFVVLAIGTLGLGVEMWEEATRNSTPDRGIQLAQALFSMAWIGLGIGLWLVPRDVPTQPGAA